MSVPRPATFNRRDLFLCAALVALIAGLVAWRGFQARQVWRQSDAPIPPRGDSMRQHLDFLRRAEQGEIDLLLLGDSLTEGWPTTRVWQDRYQGRPAAAFGIGGNRTQHLLWRIQHGEVDGLAPSLVVIQIGTNNIPFDPPPAIALGIDAVIQALRERLPRSRILLMGVFPRGADRDPAQPAAEPDPRVAQLNALLSPLARRRGVEFLDITARFLDPSGRIPKRLMPDYLHLTEEGYRVWADALEPHIAPRASTQPPPTL